MTRNEYQTRINEFGDKAWQQTPTLPPLPTKKETSNMTAKETFTISFQDRHERLNNIADEIEAYLQKKWLSMNHDRGASMLKQGCDTPENEAEMKLVWRLKGYCEQLRVDADGIKRGMDGAKGIIRTEGGKA